MLFTLRFFKHVTDGAVSKCLCTVMSSDIPKKGHLVYLGNNELLNNGKVYLVKRVVRAYSGDSRDLAKNQGDALTSVEIEVVPTSVSR